MSRLPGNEALSYARGRLLGGLLDINALDPQEKRQIYSSIIPPRLFTVLDISPETHRGSDGTCWINIIAPEGMALARIEVGENRSHRRANFFLDIAETHYHQMELSFCIINDPASPYFAVDIDDTGNDNCFTSLGRNIPEEIRAMQAGLYPNQTSHGLRMFGEFFQLFERFVDAIGMDIILAEPLTYDNAIRYEKYGFDYLSGRRLMVEIDREFRPGGVLFKLLDGSTPFRMPGMEKTVHGRSWAIHDGILNQANNGGAVNPILDEGWENVKIYKSIGISANIITFKL